ncbi:terminase family protein [Sphingomonas sp. NSE70-1]|uniref:Terminase family protein n=1 Tax=Sphingomonas caseinilyticus TaxID=2908205 RepID=A0ABT0RX38_9SPHN|nr:terminase family protein [Sphingomonas caseinilyticus]MCL6699597.1 terminase family protein [Sphingomonas caseinilyticus]
MSLGITPAQLRRFLALSPEEQEKRIEAMSFSDMLDFDVAFETWAHKSQLPPPGEGWRVWLMMAGRGFGKTRAGAEWVHKLARAGPRRIALVGATIDEARNLMVEGVSGLLSIARNNRSPVKWEPSLNRLTWPNGSIATLYSGDNPDGLRGPEHHIVWADELAKWRRAEESWNNMQMGLRLGSRPRVLVTTTPRPGPLLEQIRKQEWTVETHGRTKDNICLPKRFVQVMLATYGGTRLGRQELDGELLSEAEGSLFPRVLLEGARVQPLTPLAFGESPFPSKGEGFERIVVGVDPPVSVGGDACGIVVAGRRDGKLYVLADRTVDGVSPEGWAMAVARASAEWSASHVIAEANQGGAMVKSVLNAADPALRVKLVHATRGKSARAEPIAIRFEKGQAFLAGCFPELEAELSGLQVGGKYEGPSRSPDRADACIWALKELSETRSGVPRVRML